MAKDKKFSLVIIAFGAVVIFLVSMFQGFALTFIEMLSHVKSDLTVDLVIHIYILGWILLLYGIYKYVK